MGVQGGQARLHLPREGAREVPGLGFSLARAHWHVLTMHDPRRRWPSEERRRRISIPCTSIGTCSTCSTHHIPLAKSRGGGACQGRRARRRGCGRVLLTLVYAASSRMSSRFLSVVANPYPV